MKYRNKETGIVIDSPGPISGPMWEAYDQDAEGVKEPEEGTQEDKQEEPKEPEKKPVPTKAEGGEITRADIMRELDAFGIKYDKKATKKELLKVMESELEK